MSSQPARPTKSTSLRSLLPSTLSTPRLTLEIFDYSDAHYDTLLSCLNSNATKEQMGDWAIRTPAQFDALNLPVRISPTWLFGGDGSMDNDQNAARVNMDVDLYYLPRLKRAEAHATGQPLVTESSDSQVGPLIGGISICQRGRNFIPDVGWNLLEAYHGQGYATEATREVLRIARDVLGMQKIVAVPNPSNKPSWRVAEKLGMKRGPTIKMMDLGDEAEIWMGEGVTEGDVLGRELWAMGEKEAQVTN